MAEPVFGNVTRRYARAVTVRLIGYWHEDEDDRFPDPHDLVDESWDGSERSLVASYLEEGFVPWVYAGLSTCRFCGASNGCAELTDGVYLWPEGLAHYVREHAVRLPTDVVEHIVAHSAALEALTVDHDWWRSVTNSD